MAENKKIGLTLGDFNGVGPELIMKLCSDDRIFNYCTIVIYGSSRVFSFYRKHLQNNIFVYSKVQSVSQANPKKFNLIDVWLDEYLVQPGLASNEAGKCARLAFQKATEDLKNKQIDALITAPVNKKTFYGDDFPFKGHTEYLATQTSSGQYLMMMVGENIKVGTVTGHIPLSEVPAALTKEIIFKKLEIFFKSLSDDFGISKPKIAVLGLNPHAGDNGLIGKEDKEIIEPIINEHKEKGKLVAGPFSADGFFGSGNYTKYDGILSMYHDQGLIPFKTLEFDRGVNFTAGLPFVRTSPDHGVAYTIAGTNSVNEQSFRNAVFCALDILKSRVKEK